MPVMMMVVMMMLPSDVDPRHDGYMPGRLRCAGAQHCDTGKHYCHQNECPDRMKKLYSHDFASFIYPYVFEMQSAGRNSLVCRVQRKIQEAKAGF